MQGLSEAQVKSYRTEGYVVVPSLFDAQDLKRIDETIREITRRSLTLDDYSGILEIEPEPVDGEYVPRRIYNPFEQHEAFRGLATDERLMACIHSLIGPDVNIHHSKLNMKPARVGSVVDWHQDLTYFPHTNDDLVTTLIYLDDATQENGCLQVLPRHHHHFFDHADDEGLFAGMITEEIADGRFGQVVPLPAPAGSAIFMHCVTPHSSLPNLSDRARRTLIFEYRASDAFPIFYGDKIVADEALSHHLTGKPAQFARFGGLAPYVPRIPKNVTSLYDLQSRSRDKSAVTG